jgi:hypothetical protein
MDDKELSKACKRHNKTALKVCELIIDAVQMKGADGVTEAMIMLESVMAGVLGFYLRDAEKAKVVLDVLAKGAIDRIAEKFEEKKDG